MDTDLARRPVAPATFSPRRWVAFCAAAEGIGMTAAAAAAAASHALVGEPSRGGAVVVALSLIVAGGLVEGVALGGLQAWGLAPLLPGLDRRRWLLVTAAVAGVGCAAATAPAVLGGLVRHHWRWVGANAVAWAPTMAVIFLGATTPDAGWAWPAVVALGTVTGMAAGAVLGLASGWFLPTLDGGPAHNRVVLAILSSGWHRVADRGLVALRLRGRVTGRVLRLPVQYAGDSAGLVVAPGRPEKKRWWRNLGEPARVEVLLRGRWRTGVGQVLWAGDAGHDMAVATYRVRWPRARLPEDAPVVRIRVDPRAPDP